jgi:hypothetical protein
MTVKLDLPPHVEKAYLAEARAKGVQQNEQITPINAARWDYDMYPRRTGTVRVNP